MSPVQVIEQIPIVNEEIMSLIRELNPNKTNGSDGISGQCFSYAIARSFYPSE